MFDTTWKKLFKEAEVHCKKSMLENCYCDIDIVNVLLGHPAAHSIKASAALTSCWSYPGQQYSFGTDIDILDICLK